MNDLSVDIVTHVLAVLDELIVPHVDASAARAFADICSRLLHQVVMRERQVERLSAAHAPNVAQIESELARLFDLVPTDEASDGAAADEDVLIRALATDGKVLTADAQQRLGDLKTRWVQLERALLEKTDPEVQFGFASIFQGGRIDRSRVKLFAPSVKPIPEMTPKSLQDCLRGRGPAWRHATVRTLSRLQGGFSKQTLRAQIDAAPWGGDHFVIRQDRPDAFTQTTVITEFPIIQAMFAAGLRVPEPLCCIADKDLGPPFIITRQAPGGNGTGAWKDDAVSVRRFADTLAKQLALLHAIAPQNAGLVGDTGAIDDGIRRNIEHWSALGKLELRGSSRVLRAIRAWLLNNIPTSASGASVVHGDVTLANLLTERGSVTALLDWEFCHLGDPQEDLNFARMMIEGEGLGSWDDFVASYVAAGGPCYVPEDAAFWKVWASFRSAAGCANALLAYRAGSYGSAAEALTLAVAGINFGPRFELEAAETIVSQSTAKNTNVGAMSHGTRGSSVCEKSSGVANE